MRWFKRSAPVGTDARWEQIQTEIRKANQRRFAETATRRDLVTQVSRILFDADLIGINFETNTDEYDAEAETIVIGLPRTAGVGDVQDLTHKTFVQWFDAQIAGPPERYRAVAATIWGLWQRYSGRAALEQ